MATAPKPSSVMSAKPVPAAVKQAAKTAAVATLAKSVAVMRAASKKARGGTTRKGFLAG